MDTKMNLRLLSCVVAVAMLSGIVSCARLAPQDEPATPAAVAAAAGGYPDIQAMIDAALDKAIAVVDAAAARNVGRDPRYATLSRALHRDRDSDWAAERVLNPDGAGVVTEEDQEEIDSLIGDDPELNAAFKQMSEELEAAYAAIPPIEISVQDLDDNDNPVGDPYTIRSENGVIDFGFQSLTVQQFLLWTQSQQSRPERGFVVDVDWEGGGRPWPNDIVWYFFDSGLSESDKSWMRDKLDRVSRATGVRLQESASTSYYRTRWDQCRTTRLKISRENMSHPGEASVGYVWGCPFLQDGS